MHAKPVSGVPTAQHILTVQFSCCLGMAPGFPVFSFWEHSGTEPVTVLSAEMSIPSDHQLYTRIHAWCILLL
jgi:hypothetical protein